MFIKLTRAQGVILLPTKNISWIVEYKEMDKPCGSYVHFEREEHGPLWVTEDPDEILAPLAGDPK